MTIDSVATLVETLRYEHLLAQDQLAQLTEEGLAGFDGPQSLAKHLVQLGWLTVYQINHLFEDRAQDLVIGPYCIRDRLGEGGVSEVYKAWDLIRQVASGLQYARTMGLVHRDIKPANLFLITPPGYDKPAPGITWKRP